MKEVILHLKPRDIIDVNPTALTQMSLLRSKKLRDLLVSYIGDVNIEDLQIPFKCVATDILSGQLHIFESGSTALAVQASSTIPCVFKPVEYKGELLVDGGCLCRVPTRLVKEMGADVVVSIDVLKNCSERVEKPSNILNMLLRVYDIIDAHTTDSTREKDEGLYDLWIAPEMKGMSQYVIKDLDKAYNEGYEEGRKNIDKIKELLA
jgi:NTE family protein